MEYEIWGVNIDNKDRVKFFLNTYSALNVLKLSKKQITGCNYLIL